MLLLRYCGNLASIDICMKCGSSGYKLNIIPLRILTALPCLKRISRVRFLVLLPLLVFLLHEASIFFDIIMWYPRVTPYAENERGTAIVVAVAISHYQ